MTLQHAQAPLPSTRTILIAAGDPDTRALYHAVLDEPAYTILECDDGAEALGQAMCGHPDLIVAESRLPRIDGLSLCSLLRTDPETRSMPIIVITTKENPSETARAMIAGADRALAKPFTPDALAGAVRDVWQRPARTRVQPPAPIAATDGESAPPGSTRRARSRMFRRGHTTTPPLKPPALHCPSCHSLLVYEHSETGGVNERSSEQWDYFRCAACGPYQYRQRTRKLRSLS